MIDDVLRELRRHPLQVPVRLALMLLLSTKGAVEFGRAASTLGVKPGTLWHHVKRLEEEGYVRMRRGITIHGPRTLLEATEKGVRETMNYLRLLQRLLSLGGGGVVLQDSSSGGVGPRQALQPFHR